MKFHIQSNFCKIVIVSLFAINISLSHQNKISIFDYVTEDQHSSNSIANNNTNNLNGIRFKQSKIIDNIDNQRSSSEIGINSLKETILELKNEISEIKLRMNKLIDFNKELLNKLEINDYKMNETNNKEIQRVKNKFRSNYNNSKEPNFIQVNRHSRKK